METHVRKSLVCLATLSIAMLTVTTQAQTIMTDTFSGPDDEGWMHLDTSVGQPWGPGSYKVISGCYRLEGGGPVPPGDPLGSPLISLWEGSSDPVFSNGFLRATMRADSPGTTTSVIMRANPATFSGYLLYGNTATGMRFAVCRFDNGVQTDTSWIDGIVFEAGQDWWVELGAVGDQISGKVWKVGDPEPPTPQVEFADSTYSSGMFGLSAGLGPDATEPATVGGTFDNVSFTVPEPSSLLLAAIGAVALLGVGWCRRRQRTTANSER